MIEHHKFPAGLHLLSRWQSGDPDAKDDLRAIFDAAIAGRYDVDFAVPAPTNVVHVSGSVHMIALSILYDLYGIESAEYYKTDPERYVRANLMVSRQGLSRCPRVHWHRTPRQGETPVSAMARARSPLTGPH